MYYHVNVVGFSLDFFHGLLLARGLRALSFGIGVGVGLVLMVLIWYW